MRLDLRQPSTSVAFDAPSSDLSVTATAASSTTKIRTFTWWSPLWLFVLADVTAALLASGLTGRSFGFAAAVSAAIVLSLRMANLYQRVLLPSVLSHAGRMAMAGAAGSLAAAALTGATSAQAAVFAAVAAPLMLILRAGAYANERRAAARMPQRALVVGAGVAGQELVSRLLDHPEYGINPLGFLDSAPAPLDPALAVTVLGDMDALDELIETLDIQRIFLDAGSVTEQELADVLDCTSGLDVEISVLPVLTQRLSTLVAVENVAGSTVLSYRPSRHHGISWTLKRAIDIAGAVVMLLTSAPIWLLVTAAIKLESRGPVLFKQVRVGRHGEPFTIYKFRSMEQDAEARKTLYLDLNAADGPYFKLERDPRITRVGRIIRRYSIDEIPQVLNVLRGEMSLVGPRPALESEVAEYPDWFRRRLAVRPGLSGLWQVSGRFLVPFAEATRLDVSYVDHWSIGLDLQILARTPAVVLSGRGAR